VPCGGLVGVKAVDIQTREQGKERQGGKKGEVEILHLLTTPSNVFNQKQLRG
jgi:hypothetical protein